MRDSSATPERIAAQLLAAPPAGEEWAAEVLDRAAKIAAASGAMRRRRHLPDADASRADPRRAPPGGAARARHGGGRDRRARTPSSICSPPTGSSRCRSSASSRRTRSLASCSSSARPSAPPTSPPNPGPSCAEQLPDLVAIVESVELISLYFGARVPDAEERYRKLRILPADPTPGQSVLAAAASYDWLYRGGGAEECANLASTAIERAQQLEIDTGLTWIVANVVLVAAERPEALELWDRALARSHEQGSMFGVLSVQLWRGFTELHHGDLEDAEESLRAGIEQISLLGGATLHYAYGLLASTLLARGRVEEAEAALASIDRPDGVGDGALIWKVAEIELMLARGRNEEALAAAETHIELCDWRDNPAFAPGRRLKARALTALGRTEDAEQVLREDLELAEKWGSPGTVGRALAQLGAVRGDDGIEDLERGVGLLEDSPLKLDLARALTALGSAIRRQRRQTDAREPLRRALELAESCGAGALTAEIRTELHATGARPRSSALSGPASLTASERRVADLAAGGDTNKEIAQALFVTPKTVEVHLSNAYRKLDISGRRELASALA